MIEFDSDRKMMTVIAKNLKTEKVYAFSKGADSSILPKIKDKSTST
jgi:magnesium-transporting ATPase (P-type)